METGLIKTNPSKTGPQKTPMNSTKACAHFKYPSLKPEVCMSWGKGLNLILNKHVSIAGNLQQSERAKDIRAHPKSMSNQPDFS